MGLFSREDLHRIEAAVGRAEARSAGEIVVGVVRRSDDYAVPRAAVAASWTVGLALGLHVVWPHLAVVALLLAQLPVGLGTWALLGVPPITRRLVGRQHAARCTRARALQMFAERGVHRTRDHSGILILISELEHQVTILGDGGIHGHVGADGWEHQVQRLVAGIRAGAPAATVIEVIDDCGAILAQKFPRRPDDVNELPDHVFAQ